MKTFIVIFVVLGVFGTAFVKGFDKKAAVAEFMAKADVCKGEVGAKEGNLKN